MMVAVAPGAALSALESAGAEFGGTITGDEASSSANEGVAAVELGGNLVLLTGGPELMIVLPALAGALDSALYTGWFSSVADTWLWQVDTPAAQRRWVASQGETVEDAGEPDPAETGVSTLDEDGLFTLLQTATGFTVDDALLRAECLLVTLPG